MPDVSSAQRNGDKGPAPLAERVLALIASGQGTTRTELAAMLGASPSTISLTVGQLVERGLVTEQGTRASTGGRPRKVLRIGARDEFAVAADLGSKHARIGVVLPGGELTDVTTVPLVIAEGPE